jgi:hypothetical protein
MIPLDDDLLTALRAARPGTGCEPSAASPEATAMLTQIMRTPRGPAPRWTRRRLLLAAIPATAAAAAAMTLAVSVTSSGPGGNLPTASSVRTAVLDAFSRDSGDVFAMTQTIRGTRGPVLTQRAWTYPAFPVPGQQVRFRLFMLRDGVPVEDTESIYIQDAAASRLSMKTTQGPRSAEIIDVQYATRTWSRQRSSSVLLAGSLSPRLIRDEIASGRFTVTGTGHVRGRPAIEITWSYSPGNGPLIMMATLWVGAHSYVPLRSTTTMQARLQSRHVVLQTSTTEYHILPPTPANLDLLIPPIPPGFTRTSGSPHF